MVTPVRSESVSCAELAVSVTAPVAGDSPIRVRLLTAGSVIGPAYEPGVIQT